MHNVFSPIKKSLAVVENNVCKSLNKKNIIDIIAESSYTMEDYLTSALVIFTAKIFSEVNERVLSLAETMQYIFFAMSFHNKVAEDVLIKGNLKLDSGDNVQYPVLIGDFIYGKFFVNLCNSNLLCYLDSISKIICEINEESVKDLKNQDSNQNSLAEDPIRYSIIFAGCCLLGAVEAGAGDYQQKCLAAFGWHLGRAMEKDLTSEQRDYYYKQSLIKLDNLKSNKVDELKNLVFYLKKRDTNNNKMVC